MEIIYNPPLLHSHEASLLSTSFRIGTVVRCECGQAFILRKDVVGRWWSTLSDRKVRRYLKKRARAEK
jgi:hypothetical protein